jgi:hypothetical protein
VAVKVIRAELAADPEFRTRFRREVAAARKVNGLYTALVVDTDLDGPMPWLATVYVAGPSLAEAVTSYGPLPAASVLMLAAGLAEGLGAIHAVGVVHRDLKPSNVLLADDGPRVIDFGISQAAEASTLTHAGLVVGSPGFMSPEQAEGREVGPPSDVFSLGSVLTFAATGSGPFGTGPTAALVYRVVHSPPDLHGVTAEIRSLVQRCLAKDASRRPTPRDLLAELGDTDLAAVWRPAPLKGGFPWHAPRDSAPPGATAADGSRVPEPADEAFLAEVAELGQISAELTVTHAPERLRGRPATNDSLLLEPALPGTRRPSVRRNLVRRNLVTRHMATIGVPVIALVAVAALTLALLKGRVLNLGPPVGNVQSTLATATFGRYPGQQQRGVLQKIDRVVASGNTIVAMGSQTSGDITRQQFFVSADGGATWHLAQVHAPGAGEPPLGHATTLLAGGPGGWAAVGPQAVWTSRDGLSWTLAATHGITPQRPGDNVWVVTKTADGFLAAGDGAAGRGATQAVIWTSSDGVTWQRMTAAQLGLAAPGERVQNIAYATSRGDDTVISGSIFKDGATYSGAWLSTDGGSGWTRVTIPADHGAGTGISGLGFDGSGLVAVRAGRAASGTQMAWLTFPRTGSPGSTQAPSRRPVAGALAW